MNSNDGEITFVADRMLGRLAKYLRLMGYDVSYPQPCADRRLLGIARSEGRILLTRDSEIARAGTDQGELPPVIYIASTEVHDQVTQLAKEGFISRLLPPRCAECNTLLERMSFQEGRHLAPRFIVSKHYSFQYCRSCNIVLWEGSHWERFYRMASELFNS